MRIRNQHLQALLGLRLCRNEQSGRAGAGAWSSRAHTHLLSGLRPYETLRDSSSVSTATAPTATHPLTTHPSTTPSSSPVPLTTISPTPPLSILPLPSLLRSLLTATVSSSPTLLTPTLKILSVLANPSSPFLNPSRNPVLHYLLKKTFYSQFCAGETERDIKGTVEGLKEMGYEGVILGYAREVVLGVGRGAEQEKVGDVSVGDEKREIEVWKRGNLETIGMVEGGDHIALKFTGAGSQALHNLSHNLPPTPKLEKAIVEVCDLATAKNVGLLFDAEQSVVQSGIDSWTLSFQRRYNNRVPHQAVVFGTYQAYLKSTPGTLAKHLAAAKRDGFTLGVKLVRGAYMGTEPGHLLCSSKEDTDKAYDGIAECLMRRKYGSVMPGLSGEGGDGFPEVNVVLAGHNHESVRKALAIRTEQAQEGESRIDMIYSQLQGMADEVSCDLLQTGRAMTEKAVENEVKREDLEIPRAYKYLVWGTMEECMKYLLRRAEENRDAVERTKDGKKALAGELWRRTRQSVGLSAQ
ncbi:MAG: proline dehydrogenase [Pycnora praestabilis]|nr:MAG: proline dehydrogenase [Pycnora praestabilis]